MFFEKKYPTILLSVDYVIRFNGIILRFRYFPEFFKQFGESGFGQAFFHHLYQFVGGLSEIRTGCPTTNRSLYFRNTHYLLKRKRQRRMKKQPSSFISWEKLRDIDLVGFLASIGHEPTKISGIQYWYRSPLRNEKTPSFKVNRRLNRWYDFGIGKGGSILDFCRALYQIDLPEIVHLLSERARNRLPRLKLAFFSASGLTAGISILLGFALPGSRFSRTKSNGIPDKTKCRIPGSKHSLQRLPGFKRIPSAFTSEAFTDKAKSRA